MENKFKFPKKLQELIDRFQTLKSDAEKAKKNIEQNRKVADKTPDKAKTDNA